MPGYLIAAILLGFPLLELFLLILVGGAIGGWVFALLIASATVGWLLIKEERSGFVARMEAARDSSTSVVTAIKESGRKVIAGILLIIPGLITDVAALALLLWPVRKAGSAHGRGGFQFSMSSDPKGAPAPARENGPMPMRETIFTESPDGKTLEGDFKRID